MSYVVGSNKCKKPFVEFPTPLKDFPCDNILKTFLLFLFF